MATSGTSRRGSSGIRRLGRRYKERFVNEVLRQFWRDAPVSLARPRFAGDNALGAVMKAEDQVSPLPPVLSLRAEGVPPGPPRGTAGSRSIWDVASASRPPACRTSRRGSCGRRCSRSGTVVTRGTRAAGGSGGRRASPRRRARDARSDSDSTIPVSRRAQRGRMAVDRLGSPMRSSHVGRAARSTVVRILDLGVQPIPTAFPAPTDPPGPTWPLRVAVCTTCWWSSSRPLGRRPSATTRLSGRWPGTRAACPRTRARRRPTCATGWSCTPERVIVELGSHGNHLRGGLPRSSALQTTIVEPGRRASPTALGGNRGRGGSAWRPGDPSTATAVALLEEADLVVDDFLLGAPRRPRRWGSGGLAGLLGAPRAPSPSRWIMRSPVPTGVQLDALAPRPSRGVLAARPRAAPRTPWARSWWMRPCSPM